MIKKMGKKKIIGKCCLECSKFIDPKKDYYIQLSTYNRSHSPDDHAFFHFQCWVDYFNKRVDNKMRANVRFMQEKAMSLFNSPAIKNLLMQVQGSDMALNMLQMPIRDRVVSKKIVISKIQNDRKRKRSAKKRKA